MGRAAPPPRILCSPSDRKPAEKGTYVTEPRSPEEQRILVIIPTYNESENVERIVARTRTAVPKANILIADDNSPDGTGKLADTLAEADDHVHVMHRIGKEGLGAAYLAGFEWGLSNGYDILVEMDADGSHQPEQLPRLLEALAEADLVLGSRWVVGGSVVNWPKSREVLSRGGNLWTRIALGIPLKDATGGYRAFRRATLLGLGLDNVASAGYCFQVDLAWRALKAGFRVVEVPITFVEREHGDSKMNQRIVIEALVRTTAWGIAHRANQLRSVGHKRQPAIR
jgi:dolichol-phosphate mannosyltransferase